MKKIAVIGASDLQNPLILKAQEKGYEVHAFAWEAGDVGERTADVFHPVSIVEHEAIADICREVEVDGVCTIASDLGNITANEVARMLGLPCNSRECVEASTDKHAMRECFAAHGCPSPKSVLVREGEEARLDGMAFPLIVKPTDRSGSRGVSKVEDESALVEALEHAFDESFSKEAVVEEYVEGDEYSIEGFTWDGEHHVLAITQKITTGAPSFIERGHIEPAPMDDDMAAKVTGVVKDALDALGVEMGASHSEVRITSEGDVRIIEIGSRMGGDCIGSDLVPLTTGIDFVGAVVDAACGVQPDLRPTLEPVWERAEVRYLFDEGDVEELRRVRRERPESIVRESTTIESPREVSDSSTRLGFYIMAE